MRVAVSFCNQAPGNCGLAIIDGDHSRWAPMPDGVRSTGATGMTFANGRLVVAAQLGKRGGGGDANLMVFDESWNLKVDAIDGPIDAHDIVSTDNGLVIASSGTDSIWLVADKVTKLWSIGEARTDNYHVNGATIRDGRVLASMFGPKGSRSWREATNGRVVDVLSGEVLVEGLHHPHSPRFCDDELWVCDSSRGELVIARGDHQRRISVGGYTRGLWIGPEIALVGVSAARTRSRSQGTENVVSDDSGWAGLAVVDRRRHVVTDRVDLSALGGEIYDVIPVETFELPPGTDARVERCLRLLGRIADLEENLRSLRSTSGSLRNIVKNVSIHGRRLLK